MAWRVAYLSTVAGPDIHSASSTAKSSSEALRKELGFTDLVFACVLMVVIPDFYGTAAKAGAAQMLLWLLALVFFFLPQAFVVSHLNRKLPLEGGLYAWARSAFGDLAEFLVAWMLRLHVALYVASMGLVTTNCLEYVLGPDFSWTAGNGKIFLVLSR